MKTFTAQSTMGSNLTLSATTKIAEVPSANNDVSSAIQGYLLTDTLFSFTKPIGVGLYPVTFGLVRM
jgi:hypothetical protein